MGDYERCPQCQNVKRGDRLMQCKKCGTIFCSACRIRAGLLGDVAHCPKCKLGDFTRLGSIN
jgi:hypothetical protein